MAASQQGGDLLFLLVFKDTKVLFLIHTRVRAHTGEREGGGEEGVREKRERLAQSHSRPQDQLTHASTARASSPVLPGQGTGPTLLSVSGSKGQGQISCSYDPRRAFLSTAAGEGQG